MIGNRHISVSAPDQYRVDDVSFSGDCIRSIGGTYRGSLIIRVCDDMSTFPDWAAVIGRAGHRKFIRSTRRLDKCLVQRSAGGCMIDGRHWLIVVHGALGNQFPLHGIRVAYYEPEGTRA